MATYTVYLSFTLGKGGSVSWAYPNSTDFSHTTGTSSNPLDVAPNDTVNFVEVSGSSGGGTVTGPSSANLTIFGATTSFSYSAGDGIGTAASLTVGSGSDTTQQLVAAPSGGGPTDSFYIRRETPPVVGTIKFGTTTAGGTDSIVTEEPDGGVQFTANINTTNTAYYWDLERTNTNIGSANRFSFSAPTSGSFSATANTDITPITTGGPSTNVSLNHWGYQGIGFTVDLFTGPSRTGTLLDSINWTIYENTSGISDINAGTGSSISNVVTSCLKQPLENSTFGVIYKLTHRTTAQSVVTSQCSAVSTRLRNITNGTNAATGSVAVGSYTATTQPSGPYSFTATSPSTTGNRETFQVQLFNGNEWINNGGLNFVLAFEPAANTQAASETITLADRSGGYTISITNSDTTAGSEAYAITTTDYGAGGTSGFNTTIINNRINNTLEASLDYANSTATGTVSFGIPEADIPTSGSQTYYIYAYRRASYSGENVWYRRGNFSLTIQTNDPDIDVTETSAREIVYNATSYTMTFSNGTSGDQYQLRHYDAGAQTGTIVNSTPATADGSGNFSISLASSDLPASGTADTKWYSLYARRPIANGGDNQYDYANGTTLVNTLNLTRRPDRPTVTTSDDDAASANVGIILNVTNPNSFTPTDVHLYQYKNAVLINSANPTFTGPGNYSGHFTQPRNTGADTYYYRAFLQDDGVSTASATPQDNMTGSSALSVITQSDYQAGYIAPDINVSASNITTNTINGNNQTINISGKNSLDSVRILRTSPSSLGCGNTGTGATTGSILLSGEGTELPSVGSVFNYQLQAERPAGNGGDDAFDNVTSGTNNTFSIGRLNNFAFASPGTVSGGTTYYQNDQITGIVGSLTVSHSGDGDFAVSSSATIPSAGSFSTASKSISNNQYVHVRSTAGIAEGNTETTTISINGQSANFVVTTPYNSTLYDIDVSFVDFSEIGETFLILTETNGDVPGSNPSWGDFQQGDQVRFNHISTSDFTTFTLSSIDTNFWTYGSTSASIARNSSLTLTVDSGSSPSSDTLFFGGEGSASFSRSTVSTPTYSLSAGSSSVNEGTANTMTVTTTQVTNGTVLYWAATPFPDFAVTENTNNQDIGTVTINSNTGSFSVTPLADSATEGAETATIYLYTNSARTTQVSSASFTINDTSQGSSGGGTSGGSGTDTYGLEVYFGSPEQVVFGSNLRATNLIAAETNVTLSGASSYGGTNGGTQSFTGIADATDSNKIQVVLEIFNDNNLEILRSTASGGTITIRNKSTATVNNLGILIFRLS